MRAMVVSECSSVQVEEQRKLRLSTADAIAGLWLLGFSFCAFWVFTATESAVYLYSRGALFFLPWSFWESRANGTHYNTLEACFLPHYMLLLHMWLWPQSRGLALCCFSESIAVIGAGLLTGDALVLHDLDKMTTLHTHQLPVLVTYVLRWYTDTSHFGSKTYSGSASVRDLVGIPTLVWLAWAIVYAFVIFGIARESIKRNGYKTLYSLATQCDSGPGALFARHVPKAYQPMVFFLLHLLMSLSGFTLAVFAWHSQTIHTALLVLSLGMCVINGLKHYRHAYAHKQD